MSRLQSLAGVARLLVTDAPAAPEAVARCDVGGWFGRALPCGPTTIPHLHWIANPSIPTLDWISCIELSGIALNLDVMVPTMIGGDPDVE